MPPKGHRDGCTCAVCAPDPEKRSAILAAGRQKRQANLEVKRAAHGSQTVKRSASRADKSLDYGAGGAPKSASGGRRKNGGNGGKSSRRDDASAPPSTEGRPRGGFLGGLIDSFRV